jgi:hypothetical protein
MAARRVRRAHHGRLWRPARVATPTRAATATTAPPSRKSARPATRCHHTGPRRPPRHPTRAPAPALTPAPAARLARRSGPCVSLPAPQAPAHACKTSTTQPAQPSRKEQASNRLPQKPTTPGGALAGPAVSARPELGPARPSGQASPAAIAKPAGNRSGAERHLAAIQNPSRPADGHAPKGTRQGPPTAATCLQPAVAGACATRRTSRSGRHRS